MPNTLKGLVSKKKIRFQKEGFDLDLTYITNSIIAMGYPAQSWEGIYRNHIDDVVSFFKKLHEGHYQIFNLCKERQIDEQKFEPSSINHSYPFDDHNPPRFHKMLECCEDIKTYLEKDEKHVVAVQCKAGKGRTGVIVCSVLVLQGTCRNASEALLFYGKKRTANGKGVTIPSQIRYIYYFDYFLQNKLAYTQIHLKFNYLVLEELPNIAGNGYEIQMEVYGYDNDEKIHEYYVSPFYEVKKDSQRSLKLVSDEELILHGDIKFQIVLKAKFGKREKLCHCWLNTFFIANKPPVTSLDDRPSPNNLDIYYNSTRKHTRTISDPTEVQKPSLTDALSRSHSPNGEVTYYKLTLQKHEIDKANKDCNNKVFPANFAMSFSFELPQTFHQDLSEEYKPPNVGGRCRSDEIDSNIVSQTCSSRNTDTHWNKQNDHVDMSEDYSNGDVDEGSASSESSTKSLRVT